MKRLSIILLILLPLLTWSQTKVDSVTVVTKDEITGVTITDSTILFTIVGEWKKITVGGLRTHLIAGGQVTEEQLSDSIQYAIDQDSLYILPGPPDTLCTLSGYCIVLPEPADGNGLIDSLPLGSVSINADTNDLRILNVDTLELTANLILIEGYLNAGEVRKEISDSLATVDAGAQISDSLSALTGSLTSPYLPYWQDSVLADSPLEYLNDQSIGLPSGTTLEQPLAGRSGALRYDTDLASFTGDDGTSWRELAWGDLSNVSGFTEDAILIGAADGSIENSGLLFDDSNNSIIYPSTSISITNGVYSFPISNQNSTILNNAINGSNASQIDNSILAGSNSAHTTTGTIENTLILGNNNFASASGNINKSLIIGSDNGSSAPQIVNTILVGNTNAISSTISNSALIGNSAGRNFSNGSNTLSVGTNNFGGSGNTLSNSVSIGLNVFSDAPGSGSSTTSAIGFGSNIFPNATDPDDTFGAGSGVFSALTTGVGNVAIGQSVFTGVTSGSDNISIGRANGLSATDTGITGLIAIGRDALRSATSSELSYSIAIGYQAGENTSATSSLHLGRNANAQRDKEIYIGSPNDIDYDYATLAVDQVKLPVNTRSGVSSPGVADTYYDKDSIAIFVRDTSSGKWKRIAWLDELKYNTFSTTTGTPSDTLLVKDRGVYKFDAVTASGTQAIDISSLSTGDSFLFLCSGVDTNTMTVDIDDTTSAGGFIRHTSNGDFSPDATESFTVEGTYKFIFDGTDLIIIDIN